MPKFSIIIPVYNVAPYLRECLGSVLAQTYAGWEAICVDDGSTDGSGAILDEYATKDSRFKVIHQKNAGVSAARNAALDVAKGEWIGFVDADDKVEPPWLQSLYGGISRHPNVDWVRTSYRDWLEDGSAPAWGKDSPHVREEKEFTAVAETVWEMMAYGGMPWLNVFRRNNLQGLRFDEEIWFAEDACFSADYMRYSKLLLTISDDSYRYRLRLSSATHVLKTYKDTAMALGYILKRWQRRPGRSGAFTPSIVRHMCRCPNISTQVENEIWLKFLREAWRRHFFSLHRLIGLRIKLRWLLYLIFGSPKFLFIKFGLAWLMPYKWDRQ